MARKATDLLDVFRFSDDDGNDAHERKTRRKAARRAARAAKGAKRKGSASAKGSTAFDGVHLSPRHLLLASCAGVLLLILSFTLGLATGRPGETPTRAPGLQRDTMVLIRATLPVVDPTTRKATDPERIRRKLRLEYGIENRHLRIRKEDGQLILEVGPFRSEESATRYLRSSGLELAHLCMDDPFRWPVFVPYRR